MGTTATSEYSSSHQALVTMELRWSGSEWELWLGLALDPTTTTCFTNQLCQIPHRYIVLSVMRPGQGQNLLRPLLITMTRHIESGSVV